MLLGDGMEPLSKIPQERKPTRDSCIPCQQSQGHKEPIGKIFIMTKWIESVNLTRIGPVVFLFL